MHLLSLTHFNCTLILTLPSVCRFYDKKLFEEDGIEYAKIKCAGFGSVPNPEQVNKFVMICKLFWSRNPMKVRLRKHG